MRVTTIPRPSHRGATLLEVLVALILSAFLGAAALRLLDRALRFVTGTTLIAESRSQLSATEALLRGAIEESSAPGGDLRAVADSSMVWTGNIAHAIGCRLGIVDVEVPPAQLASGIILAWWNDAPQPGDVVYLFDEGPRAGRGDDRWFSTSVQAIRSVPNGCAGTPYVDPLLDAGKSGWRITLSDSLPPTVRAGTTVRLARPQRLALYRSAGQWMLGWSDSNAVTGGWNGIQPVAGPLAPYASPPAGGLSMTWLDSLGAPFSVPLTAPRSIAAVRLATRALTAGGLRMDGRARGVRSDSLTLLLPLRNRQ